MQQITGPLRRNSFLHTLKHSDILPAILGLGFVLLAHYTYLAQPGYGYMTGPSRGPRTHTWSAGYYGNYFFQHFDMPDLINTGNYTVGNVYPMFYGKFFYFIMGVAGYLTNYSFALKLVVVVFSWLLYWVIYKTVRLLGQGPVISVISAVLVIYAVYPLSNYFSRAAYVEWFGNINLWIATFAWVISLLYPDKWRSLWYKLVFVVFMILGITGHAIATLYSSYIIVLIILFSLALVWDKNNKRLFWQHALSLGVSGVIIVLACLSWLYVCLRYMDVIFVGDVIPMVQLYDSVDEITTKLSPWVSSQLIGFSVKTLRAGTLSMVALLAVFLDGALWAAGRKGGLKKPSAFFMLCSIGMVLLGLAILANTSIFPGGITSPFKELYAQAQFACRSSNQVNLCFVAACILAYMAWHASGRQLGISLPRAARLSLAGLYILSIFFSVRGVWVKNNDFLHTVEESKPQGIHVPSDYSVFPDVFHGRSAYYVFPQQVDPDPDIPLVSAYFPVNPSDFDDVGSVELILDERTQVNVSIYPFPTNYLMVNGEKYTLDDMYVFSRGEGDEGFNKSQAELYITLEPGQYTLEYHTELPMIYRVLNTLSKWLVLLAVVSLAGYSLFMWGRLMRAHVKAKTQHPGVRHGPGPGAHPPGR